MTDAERDHLFIGQAFTVMFVLAFIYMGALSAALEGWKLAFTILSWSGMTILVGSLIALLIPLFKETQQ